MTVPAAYVDLAGRLAEASGSITRHYFRSLPEVGEKSDTTPVTVADWEAEVAMRKMILANYPEHGIVGEEGGAVRENAEFVWVLDPIDGTKNYASGSYQFGTLVSLLQDSNYVLGIIDQPILRERWLGVRGQPTTFNGKPIKSRKCDSLKNAWMYSTTPAMFKFEKLKLFEGLADQVQHSLFGTDCIGYGLLASGYIDIVCEAQMNLWDYAAHVPIVEGAGGVISDWGGNPLTLKSGGTVLASGDKRVHDAALKALAGSTFG